MSRNIAFPRRIAHYVLMLPLTLLLLGTSGAALAEGIWDNCTLAGSSYEYYPPMTIPIPRDISVGDPFGPWITAPATPAWTCTRTVASSGTAVDVYVDAAPRYNPIGSLTLDGETYSYYPAGTATPQLGYIARWRASVDGVYTPWTPQTYAGGNYKAALGTITVSKTGGQTYGINLETQIRLVKRSNALGPGTTIGTFDAMLTRFVQRVGTVRYSGMSTLRTSRVNGGNISFGAVGTCTTPDVNVVLPDAPRDTFTGIGSNVGETPFNLLFNNCPAGLSRIQYTLAPTTTVINAADGVVALNAASTARGLGIRVSQGNGTPLQLNTGYQVESYDPSQAGNYRVGLRAGYRQTEANVVAGSAATALTMSVLYR